MDRKGEKIGWIGGWAGSFIWLLLFSLIWLGRGKAVGGAVGLVLFALAVVLIFALAPWKRPAAAYWKLMLPIYVIFFGSAGWCLHVYGGIVGTGLGWPAIFWVCPILMPLVTIGRRKWEGTK
jgi:MFS family permease